MKKFYSAAAAFALSAPFVTLHAQQRAFSGGTVEGITSLVQDFGNCVFNRENAALKDFEFDATAEQLNNTNPISPKDAAAFAKSQEKASQCETRVISTDKNDFPTTAKSMTDLMTGMGDLVRDCQKNPQMTYGEYYRRMQTIIRKFGDEYLTNASRDLHLQ
jgi:hypothetical protein